MKPSDCLITEVPWKGGNKVKRFLTILGMLALALVAVSVVSAGPYTANPNLRLRVASMAYNAGDTGISGTSDVTIDWEPITGAVAYHVYKTTGNFIDYNGTWPDADRVTIYTDGTTAHTFTGGSALSNYRNYFVRVLSYPGAQETILRVYPPDKIPHGNYAEDTNMCLNCHQTHTGQAARLLRSTSATALCGTCHDGTGSKYNVKDGAIFNPVGLSGSSIVASRTDGLNGEWGTLGGAFGEIVASGSSDPAGNITSNHTMGKNLTDAPGGNAASGGATLSCVSCHNPHGTSNYRILNSSIFSADVNVTAIAYTPNSANALEDRVLYGSYSLDGNTGGNLLDTGTDSAGLAARGGIMSLCAKCHSDFALSRSGNSNASMTWDVPDANHKYRHAVGISVYRGRRADGSPYGQSNLAIPDGTEGSNDTPNIKLPLENPSNQASLNTNLMALATYNAGNSTVKNQDRVQCLTCHYAHGTKKTGQNPVVSAAQDLTVGGGYTIDSLRDEDQASSQKSSTVLKRINNMGVCESCHNK